LICFTLSNISFEASLATKSPPHPLHCIKSLTMGCCGSKSDEYDEPPYGTRPVYRAEYGYQPDPYWQEQQRKKARKTKRRRNAAIIGAVASSGGGGGGGGGGGC
jgi:hypothetical protein